MPDSEPNTRLEKGMVAVVSPEFLNRDQNIFDQEPFSKITAIVAQATEVDEETLRRCLMKTVLVARDQVLEKEKLQGNYHQKTTDIDTEMLTPEQIKLFAREAVTSVLREKPASAREKNAIIPTQEMLIALNRYPFWIPYVAHVREFFDKTGKMDYKWGRGHELIESYGAWVEGKTEKRKRLLSKGLEEVFPQDVGRKKLGEVISGDNPSRRWLLRAATGNIKSRSS